MNKDFNIKSIPKKEMIISEIVMWAGIIGTSMLMLYTFMEPDGYSLLGNYIPLIFNRIFLFKYLIAIIPLELSLGYFRKNMLYKYYYSNQVHYVAKPIIIVRIFMFLFKPIQYGFKKIVAYRGGFELEK